MLLLLLLLKKEAYSLRCHCVTPTVPEGAGTVPVAGIIPTGPNLKAMGLAHINNTAAAIGPG